MQMISINRMWREESEFRNKTVNTIVLDVTSQYRPFHHSTHCRDFNWKLIIEYGIMKRAQLGQESMQRGV